MSREPHLPVQTVDASEHDVHCDLPSGRQVAIRVDGDREQLVLVGVDGAVELQVVLTPDGPVLRMPTARVSLEGADSLSLSAKRLSLEGTEGVSVASGGDVQVKAAGDVRATADGEVHLLGSMIYLN